MSAPSDEHGAKTTRWLDLSANSITLPSRLVPNNQLTSIASALSIAVANILDNNLLHNIGTEAANNTIALPRQSGVGHYKNVRTKRA